MLSGDVGEYNNGDILFYSGSESYTVNDCVLYTPSSSSSIIVAKIVVINPEGTFTVIGTSPEPIEELDQNNLQEQQIIGKVIATTPAYIFLPLVILLAIGVAFILTRIITKKIIKK